MYIERPSCLGCCPFVTSVFQLFLQSKHFSWLQDRPATKERLTTMPKIKYPWIPDGKKNTHGSEIERKNTLGSEMELALQYRGFLGYEPYGVA